MKKECAISSCENEATQFIEPPMGEEMHGYCKKHKLEFDGQSGFIEL